MKVVRVHDAADTGLRSGDVIVCVNGRRLSYDAVCQLFHQYVASGSARLWRSQQRRACCVPLRALSELRVVRNACQPCARAARQPACDACTCSHACALATRAPPTVATPKRDQEYTPLRHQAAAPRLARSVAAHAGLRVLSGWLDQCPLV